MLNTSATTTSYDQFVELTALYLSNYGMLLVLFCVNTYGLTNANCLDLECQDVSWNNTIAYLSAPQVCVSLDFMI
jgi:hypothetical protein